MPRHLPLIAKTLTVAVAVAVVVLVYTSIALGEETASQPAMTAEQQAMMAKMMEYATPGPEHEHLAKRVGTWDYKITMHCPISDGPMEAAGVSEVKTILGGRFLRDHSTGSDPNQPFEGYGVVGYDNLKKKYVAAWIDSMSTGIMTMEGVSTDSGKTITYQGQYADPTAGGMKSCKSVEATVDEDHWTMKMYDVGEDGTDKLMMEIRYTRRK